MDDWRKDLTEDELREVEAEDYEYRRQRKKRKMRCVWLVNVLGQQCLVG